MNISIKLLPDMMTIHKDQYNVHTISSNVLCFAGKKIKNQFIESNRLSMFIKVDHATIMNIVNTLTATTFQHHVFNEYLSPEIETNFARKHLKSYSTESYCLYR